MRCLKYRSPWISISSARSAKSSPTSESLEVFPPPNIPSNKEWESEVLARDRDLGESCNCTVHCGVCTYTISSFVGSICGEIGSKRTALSGSWLLKYLILLGVFAEPLCSFWNFCRFCIRRSYPAISKRCKLGYISSSIGLSNFAFHTIFLPATCESPPISPLHLNWNTLSESGTVNLFRFDLTTRGISADFAFGSIVIVFFLGAPTGESTSKPLLSSELGVNMRMLMHDFRSFDGVVDALPSLSLWGIGDLGSIFLLITI